MTKKEMKGNSRENESVCNEKHAPRIVVVFSSGEFYFVSVNNSD